jgi:adenylate cyclase, class 2
MGKLTETSSYLDINIKARYAAPQRAEEILMSAGARYLGEDVQTDTFFDVPVGKMKLREGNIENLITHYLREEVDGRILTKVYVYEKNPSPSIKAQLLGGLQRMGVVKKNRKIFFIGNVKFHIDRFENGKSFVEIEAMNGDGKYSHAEISRQAQYFIELLSISNEDIVKSSYIDFM